MSLVYCEACERPAGHAEITYIKLADGELGTVDGVACRHCRSLHVARHADYRPSGLRIVSRPR